MNKNGEGSASAIHTRRARPQKTSMVVAQSIVNDISSGRQRPGDVLPSEKEMLDQYSVGRGTLREAMRYLETQGVLWVKPGYGPIVSSPDSSHLANTLALLLQMHRVPFQTVVDARTLLEPTMAALATENLSESEIAEIHISIEKMAASIGELRAFFQYNSEFHDLIARGSRNELFALLIASLHWISDGLVLGVEYTPRQQIGILNAHREICAAIDSRDPDRAFNAMRNHMIEFQEFLKRHYPQLLAQTIRWDRY